MKISFFGHFGTLNTGNESTLLAILFQLHRRHPGYGVCCVCTNPNVVVARYGIEAVPISTRAARLWDRQARPARRLATAFIAACAEVGQYFRAFKTLGGTDVLLIPGTGVLTDAYGLFDWGPYNLFKWVLVARLRRCKVVFVSAGAGPLDSTLGRFFVKSALSLAAYRSYRDESSLKYLKGIGFAAERDRVFPDLVFSLSEDALAPRKEPGVARRPVVGLGLMMYTGKYSSLDPRPETYPAYLEALVVFAKWLLENDYDIRLLLGDSDTLVVSDFRTLLGARFGTYDEDRVIYDPIASADDILSQLAATDFVVATRFHNILLAFMLNKPVIAISFHHKVASLMASVGMAEYCHDIHQMDGERLITQFQALEQNSEAVKTVIAECVRQNRVALEEQYDLVFEGL